MILTGHRGAAGLAPENTLPSFRKAVALGLRLVELDVRLTRDGFPVCFHDDRLDRVTPRQGLLAEWEWEPLSRVPVMPGAFGGAYPDATIPLLETVVRDLPDDCRFLVELKACPEPEALVRTALSVLRNAGGLDRSRLISFDQDLLVRTRQAEPAAAIGVIVGKSGAGALLPRAREVGAVAVHPHCALVDLPLTGAARGEGFLVNAWTVNKAEEVCRLAALGVHEVTTDYPDMALAALEGEKDTAANGNGDSGPAPGR
jgi:glycerophosphoryl diester phosphodiesterase